MNVGNLWVCYDKAMISTQQEEVFKPPKMTRKQQKFVEFLLDHPKLSATEAAMQSYNTTRVGAAQIAMNNLRKPAIQMALGDHVKLAESVIVGTMNDFGASHMPRKREIALHAATYLHDKVYGKAANTLEVKSTTVNIAIDLSGKTKQKDIEDSHVNELDVESIDR